MSSSVAINDFINYRTIDRIIDYHNKEQQKEQKTGINQERLSVSQKDRGQLAGINIKKGGENMEGDFNSLITTITSAIAGVYCAVKAIIMFIKKIKK